MLSTYEPPMSIGAGGCTDIDWLVREHQDVRATMRVDRVAHDVGEVSVSRGA
jgi:hypothetical protein